MPLPQPGRCETHGEPILFFTAKPCSEYRKVLDVPQSAKYAALCDPVMHGKAFPLETQLRNTCFAWPMTAHRCFPSLCVYRAQLQPQQPAQVRFGLSPGGL